MILPPRATSSKLVLQNEGTGVFGSSQEMGMRVAVWQASIERNDQGGFFFGIVAGNSWVREKVVCLITVLVELEGRGGAGRVASREWTNN